MSRLVMKFGGTSVADIERIRNVARHVKREADAGHEVAVVVSAMAGTTNRLVEWCGDASQLHDTREYDTVDSFLENGRRTTWGDEDAGIVSGASNATVWAREYLLSVNFSPSRRRHPIRAV